jgi:NAD(P)-dependent dehydrogenase (short-subunit alcohol dehydrogenase family)
VARAIEALAVPLFLVLAALPYPSSAATVLITGANSGLGLEFAKQYAAKGWSVIATHRRSGVPESLAAIAAKFDNVRVEHLDVTSAEDVSALAAKLKDVPIDLLINNAGVYNDRSACRDDDCIGVGHQRHGRFERLLAQLGTFSLTSPALV